VYGIAALTEGKAFVFSQPVRSVMERRKLLVATPQTTVNKAATMMAEKRVGAILVVADEHLLGIFTERDALFRVIARGLEPKDTLLVDVMTPQPITIAPDKSFGLAMLVMHENGFRHLPVIDQGKPIGIVSARDALDPDLEEFVAEERRRKHIEETR
jgi:CBS domain-containing protein